MTLCRLARRCLEIQWMLTWTMSRVRTWRQQSLRRRDRWLFEGRDLLSRKAPFGGFGTCSTYCLSPPIAGEADPNQPPK